LTAADAHREAPGVCPPGDELNESCCCRERKEEPMGTERPQSLIPADENFSSQEWYDDGERQEVSPLGTESCVPHGCRDQKHRDRKNRDDRRHQKQPLLFG
jgi:hypothetical protein